MKLDADAKGKGQAGWLASILKALMTCGALVSKFHVYKLWVNACEALVGALP